MSTGDIHIELPRQELLPLPELWAIGTIMGVRRSSGGSGGGRGATRTSFGYSPNPNHLARRRPEHPLGWQCVASSYSTPHISHPSLQVELDTRAGRGPTV